MIRHHATRRGAARRPWPALAAALALATAAVPAWSACRIQVFEIPVRIVGLRPVATVGVNGTDLPMLVDSGAFFSMLPRSTATQLGLSLQRLPDGLRIEGHTGSIEARLTHVKEVNFNGMKVPDVDFIVGGNELEHGIRGVLGRNFLAMADTEYDLAHGMVRIVLPKGECEKTNLAYWAGDTPVNRVPLVHADRGDTAIHVEARVNGETVTALMDTGAPTTSLQLHAARSAGIRESDMRLLAGRVGGFDAGHARGWSAPLASFELGAERITNNRVAVHDVDDREDEMILGLDYFLSHRILVSRLQRQVYATWNGGPVFSLNTVDGSDADEDARYATPAAPPAADDADQLARDGEAAAARGDFALALRDLDRACALAPTAANLLTRGRMRWHAGRAPEALADLDQALKLDAANAQARLARAGVRLQLDDRAGAIADLAALDAALPPFAPERADAGHFYAALDMAPEALHQWALWIASHSRDAELGSVLNARCWLRARLKRDLPQALADCRKAVDEDEGNASFHDSLGWTYLRLDEPSRAVAAFDASLERRSQAPWSLYGRALAERRQGREADAARDLAAARAQDPKIDQAVAKAGFDVAPGP